MHFWGATKAWRGGRAARNGEALPRRAAIFNRFHQLWPEAATSEKNGARRPFVRAWPVFGRYPADGGKPGIDCGAQNANPSVMRPAGKHGVARQAPVPFPITQIPEATTILTGQIWAVSSIFHGGGDLMIWPIDPRQAVDARPARNRWRQAALKSNRNRTPSRPGSSAMRPSVRSDD